MLDGKQYTTFEHRATKLNTIDTLYIAGDLLVDDIKIN